MEIIYHTADINKDITSLKTVLDSGIETVELDFVMTRDGIPIWAHNMFPTSLLNSKNIKNDQLTLFDILDINNHRCKLMLDFKLIPKHILNSSNFSKLLELLNKYDELQIQSLDLSFLKKLKEGNYSNIEIGFIINVLTKWHIDNIKKLQNLDFMSISSELWEEKNGAFIEKSKELYANIKKYAWTWATRIEDEYRIDNFINKKADGIITGVPAYVKTLTNRGLHQKEQNN